MVWRRWEGDSWWWAGAKQLLERELAAASQRRDSINAQLGNVRQMLATLTGGAAVPMMDVALGGSSETDASETDASEAAAPQAAAEAAPQAAPQAAADAEAEETDETDAR